MIKKADYHAGFDCLQGEATLTHARSFLQPRPAHSRAHSPPPALLRQPEVSSKALGTGYTGLLPAPSPTASLKETMCVLGVVPGTLPTKLQSQAGQTLSLVLNRPQLTSTTVRPGTREGPPRPRQPRPQQTEAPALQPTSEELSIKAGVNPRVPPRES